MSKENMSECMICCETYNKSLRTKVKCNSSECDFEACKSCIRQYLMNTTNDIHCMNCKKAWDQSFVVLNLNRSWVVNTYRPRRTQLLFERNISKTQEVMPEVENYMEIKRIREKNRPLIKALQDKKTSVYQERSKIRSEMYKRQDEIRREMNRKIKEITEEYNGQLIEYHQELDNIQDNIQILQSETGIEKKERSKFVMPCQHSDCKGFLSSAYKCGLCAHFTCSKCLKVLGETKDENHVCNEDDIKTAEYIKSTTRPCPKCGERIHKTSGCNQMWCIECHCAFDWNTGKIETGTVHNPHYFQFLRNNTNGGAIPRQPGDDPCADYGPYIRTCNIAVMEHILDKDEYIQPDIDTELTEEQKKKIKIATWGDCLLQFVQTISHIQYAEMAQIRARHEECENVQRHLIQYITKETDEKTFKSYIEEKDKNRQKYNDQLYILDLIVNVGKDIIRSIFKELVDNNMNMTMQEVKEKIKKISINEIYEIYKKVRMELKHFVEYCNEQFQIVSVSHNCSVLQIRLIKKDTSIRIRGNIQRFSSTNYSTYVSKSKITDVKKKINKT